MGLCRRRFRCSRRLPGWWLRSFVSLLSVAMSSPRRPTLITVLDSETADAILDLADSFPVKGVAVIAFPYSAPIWRTAAGLDASGPRAFGYEVDYVPVEQLAGVCGVETTTEVLWLRHL